MDHHSPNTVILWNVVFAPFEWNDRAPLIPTIQSFVQKNELSLLTRYRLAFHGRKHLAQNRKHGRVYCR